LYVFAIFLLRFGPGWSGPVWALVEMERSETVRI